VDAFLRSKTNRRVSFAGGDAHGIRQLSPVASYEGRVIAQNFLEGDTKHVDYTTIPQAIFITPPMAIIGDGHAGQGNGEVDITALETSLVGSVQLIVRKDMHLRWPRAETPTHYMTMGRNEDLTEVAKMAVREMIDF